MTYLCDGCGYSTEGTSYPLVCPFCGNRYEVSTGVEKSLVEGETLLAEKKNKKAAASYLRAAEGGSVEGAYRYAVFLERGVGTRRDPVGARTYYEYAADRGHSAAAGALARLLMAKGDSRSLRDGIFYLWVAAELGDATSAYLYADHAGENTLYYLTYAALRGNRDAALRAAELLYTRGNREDFPTVKGFLSIAGTLSVKLPLVVAKLAFVAATEPVLPSRNAGSVCYLVGNEAEQRKKYYLALLFYGYAIRENYLPAAVRIGDFFSAGHGVPQSAAVAGKWYLSAAEAGNLSAMVALGEMFRAGKGVEQNDKKALTLFTRCASLGNPKAQFLAAEMHFSGIGTERNLPLALSLYEQSAEQGYGPAIEAKARLSEAVSEMYNKGIAAFREKNYEEAIRVYNIAAELGHSGAIANLGFCYQNGIGCTRNLKKAIAYYRRAAMYGKESARYNLGLCYMNNEGVRFDPAMAEQLLIGSGSPDAPQLVATMKAKKEKKKARALYKTAAILYRKGKADDALRAYMLSAGMGCAHAMAVIGCHYEFSIGVPRSIDTARRWYVKSGLSLSAIDRLKRGFLRITLAVQQGKFVK